MQHDEGEYEALVASGSDAEPDRAVDPANAVLFMYTAAFTGRPNAAMLSHTALVGQALIIGRLAEIDSSYVYLNCGPLFHIATFFSTLATFLHGGTNVFTPRVDPEELCRLIETERCTGAFLLGPTTRQIRQAQRRSSLRPHFAARVRRCARLERDDHRGHVARGRGIRAATARPRWSGC